MAASDGEAHDGRREECYPVMPALRRATARPSIPTITSSPVAGSGTGVTTMLSIPLLLSLEGSPLMNASVVEDEVAVNKKLNCCQARVWSLAIEFVTVKTLVPFSSRSTVLVVPKPPLD